MTTGDSTAYSDSWRFVQQLAGRDIGRSDRVYQLGNTVCRFDFGPVAIAGYYEICGAASGEIECPQQDCETVVGSVAQLELHYAGAHRHSCRQCGRAVASDRLLQMHIDEAHPDAFTLLSRQNKLRCFVASCDELFDNSSCRLNHCVNQHEFPTDFISPLQ